MAASTKGLSLGKNEDPKKKGGGGVAKQVSLDGITVPPVAGKSKIEEPKLVNARWFGETAVTPAALTKIPQLELPSVRGVIENATPEDAGNYATALNTFASSVQTFGSSYAKKIEADQKRYENQALKVFTEFGDPTQPVKDLSSYINKIDIRIEELRNKETQTDVSKQEILDLEKLKNQITNNRHFGDVLKSKTNANIVLNRAYSWTYKKKDILVPDLNMQGGITNEDAEPKEIRVSDLDPADPRYVKAFNDYVYGDVDLSGFEHNNIQSQVANILAQDRYKQESVYANLTKEKIIDNSNNLLDSKIQTLIASENGFSVAGFNTDIQEDIEFINNSHLFTREEKTNYVKTMVAKLEYYLSQAGYTNVDEIIRTIFLGKDLGTEDAIHPLMIGPQANRFTKDNKLNKKLMLVNQIGGEAQLNIIIGNTMRKQNAANEEIEKGRIQVFTADFEDVFKSDSGNGKTYQDLILAGNLDNAFGNIHVGEYITALNEKRRELLKKHAGNQDMINAIEQSYNASIKDIENNILQTDYKQEVMTLNKMSHKIADGDISLIEDFNERLEIFDNSYPITKAQEDTNDIRNRVRDFQNKENQSLLTVGFNLVKDLHDKHASGQTEDYDKDSIMTTHELNIKAEIQKIIQDSKKFENREDQEDYVINTINAEWSNGGFIPDRKNTVTTPIYPSTDAKKNINKFVEKVRSIKGIDSYGNFQGDGLIMFRTYLNSSRPMFNKNSLFTKDMKSGMIVQWMSGEDMGKNWDVLEQNLEKDGIDVVDFFIDQSIKLGIKPDKFFAGELEKYRGKDKEERKKLWANGGKEED
tara:strand:- start:1699 stop:4140 length:2442 start_codon:yes stop_codon:yes gene_type:complete